MISAGMLDKAAAAANTDAIVQKAFEEIMATGKLKPTTAAKLEEFGFSVDNIQAEFANMTKTGFQVPSMFGANAPKEKKIPGDSKRVHAAADLLDQMVAQKNMDRAGKSLAEVIDQIA